VSADDAGDESDVAGGGGVEVVVAGSGVEVVVAGGTDGEPAAPGDTDGWTVAADADGETGGETVAADEGGCGSRGEAVLTGETGARTVAADADGETGGETVAADEGGCGSGGEAVLTGETGARTVAVSPDATTAMPGSSAALDPTIGGPSPNRRSGRTGWFRDGGDSATVSPGSGAALLAAAAGSCRLSSAATTGMGCTGSGRSPRSGGVAEVAAPSMAMLVSATGGSGSLGVVVGSLVAAVAGDESGCRSVGGWPTGGTSRPSRRLSARLARRTVGIGGRDGGGIGGSAALRVSASSSGW
jgi:hypothetical protein